MFSDKFGRHPAGLNPQWEAKLAMEASGQRILDLTGSNPTAAGIPYPPEIPALLNRESVLRYEPTPQGDPDARAAISEYYSSRGRDCRPEDLILTASTSEAYSYLFKLLCDPGDEILIPSPTYPLFDTLAELENVELVRYPFMMREENAIPDRPDFDFLRSLISTRSKALILVNPNNPTGHVCDGAEIRAYLDLAAEYDLALIVDEVFCDYLLGNRPFLPIVSGGPMVFTLNGFSKLLGLPQMKLGWIHIGGETSKAGEALEHLEWIADAFLSVNTPVQRAARHLLALREPIQTGILHRLHANLQAAEALIRGIRRIRWEKPDAGWYLILDVDAKVEDEAFALELLKRHRVHVHAGSLFGFEEGCRLVLSLLGPEAEFRDGIGRIIAFVEEFSDA